MKIITDNYIVNLITPAIACEHSVFIYDKTKVAAFDLFDKIAPDMVMLMASSLDNAVIKNINERPHLKIVIFNDNKENVDKLIKTIGNSFFIYDKPIFYDMIKYRNIKYDKNLKCDLVCIDAEQIDGIDTYYPKNNIIYRIFSSKRMIDNNNYCGVLVENLKPQILKSSTMAIIMDDDRLNAIYLDAIPINNINDADIYIENKNIEETLHKLKSELIGNSNFEKLSKIFMDIGYEDESKKLLIMMEKFK